MYVTNAPVERLSLERAVWAYRGQYLIDRSMGRLKGWPLSLTPMDLMREDRATGLIRLLTIALRVLTLLEFVVRRNLAIKGGAQRATLRPTAERLLEAFREINLTVIQEPDHTHRHLTPLSSSNNAFWRCWVSLQTSTPGFAWIPWIPLNRPKNERTMGFLAYLEKSP